MNLNEIFTIIWSLPGNQTNDDNYCTSFTKFINLLAGRGGGAPLGRTVTGGCGPVPPGIKNRLLRFEL